MSSTTADLDETKSIDDIDDDKDDCGVSENGSMIKTKSTVEMRARINHRERRRMHDLNQAMDALREVMPYANGPSVRKLSKIATISLARNYIMMLTKSIDELKHMLDDAYRSRGAYGFPNRVAQPIQYPGSWSYGSRDIRGHSPQYGCAANIYSSCRSNFDNTYTCCSVFSSNSNGSVPNLNRGAFIQGSSNSATDRG